MDLHERLELTISEFQRARPQFERFTASLESMLRQILAAEQVDYDHIEYRTKSLESFRGKLSRPGKSYKKPLIEMTDLSALRVVTYTLSAVDEVANVLQRHFKVDENKSIDKGIELKPNEIGYLSRHIVISLPRQRIKLIENSEFSGLKAEVQIRTVAQHAWAALDHRLRYKGVSDAPTQLVRRLFRLSALFELADQEFAQILEISKSHQHLVSEEIEANNLSIRVDLDSLRSYLVQSPVARKISDSAVVSGFYVTSSDPATDLVSSGVRYLPGMTKLCALSSLDSIDQLDSSLKVFLPKAETFFSELISQSRSANMSSWRGSLAFFNYLALIYQGYDAIAASPKSVKDDLFIGWSSDILQRVLTTSANLHRPTSEVRGRRRQ